MNRQTQLSHKKAVALVLAAAFCGYFFSEVILRQFVLHRAGTQSIKLSDILERVPGEIKDEVKRRITIAELKDKLLAASTDGEKIFISIMLAGVISDKALQEKYAEIIDKYPTNPESLPAFTNYLLAPKTELKTISIPDYHRFIKQLKEPDCFYAWSVGLTKLRGMNVKPDVLIEFLTPLTDIKPQYREYQRLYLELAEIAFQEENQMIEQKARKLEEICGKLKYYDEKQAAKLKPVKRK